MFMNGIFYFPKEYILTSLWPIYVISFVVVPLMIVISIKKVFIGTNKDESDIFSKDTALVYRGIAALIVMIHHYALRIQPPQKMFYYWFVGYLAVSIFFFLSGYASWYQLERKANRFWDKYFFKRLIRLLLPFVITNTIYALFYRPSITNYFKAMLALKQIRGEYNEWSVVWFLAAILIFTILFWICFRFTSQSEIGLGIFVIGTIIYIIVNGFVLHNGNYWYNSALAYATGIAYGIYRKQISTIINRMKNMLVPILTIICGGILFATTKGYQDWWIQIICSEIFLCLIISLEHSLKLSSIMLSRLGKASWEIFLIHPLVYSVYYSCFKDYFGFSGVICVTIGIVLGILINILDERLFSLIMR